MITKIFNQIEKVIKTDLGGRRLSQIETEGDFEKAIDEIYSSSTVLIVTGFCIKDIMIGETDGPLGSISLASALEKLGKKVVLVTDDYSANLLRVCSLIKKVQAPIEIVPYKYAEKYCENLLFTYKPSHVIAVERPGKAKDKRFYSMSGEDITDIIPDTDILIELSKKMNITTIAIGDGGNELGMGKVYSKVISLVKHGERICAQASADYVVVSGVSNWGAYGLVAALSLISGKMLLHNIETEFLFLKALINEGAVDGYSKNNELTVDGISLEVNLEILERLRNIVLENIEFSKTIKF